MTKKELSLGVKENLKFAKEHYEKNEGGLATMFIIESKKDGKGTGLAALLGDNGALEKRMDIIFDLGVRTGIELSRGDIDSIEAVYMVSEAWFSMSDLDDNSLKFKMPSEDPNKKEALVSSGVSQDGSSIFMMFEIKKSIDLDTGRMKVSFVPIDEANKDGVEMESPLLQRFWDGVGLMNLFDTTLPTSVRKYFMDLPLEESFQMIIKQINNLRKQ